MIKLSREQQKRARDYIYTHGRLLEQRLHAFHWNGGSAGDVRAELARFQNPDGGFGHALEPDLRLPGSSALATSVGLQVLRQLATPADDPLVRGAVRYLLDAYDPALRAWPIIPANVDEAPHAPWWSYGSDLADRWGGFLANPRAEIVGYLYDYASLVPPDLLTSLSEDVQTHLVSHPDEFEMHDLLCYMRLAETRSLPDSVRAGLMPKLAKAVETTVVRDVSRWGGYSLKPLDIVQGPNSPFAAQLAPAIEQQLDYEIERQGADGAWGPAWTWGDLYPDAWPQAQRDWSGHLTLRALRILHRFGRLE